MSDTFDYPSTQNALIIGGGHGIGLALVKHLLNSTQSNVFVTYHNKERAAPLIELCKHESRLTISNMDPTNEEAISTMSQLMKATLGDHPLDLVINCVGFLHTANQMPEKSLKDIHLDSLLEYFKTNSIVSVLLAKHLKPLFSTKSVGVFATLSARVGSIGDNKLGGWYGYRASKTALNMFMKNIAIEYKQNQLKTCVLSIHPGTTHTALSKPFSAHIKHQIFEDHETATHIMEVIAQANVQNTGSFKHWDNTDIPW